MKMQLREILILPAVDDQTIGGEVEFLYQALHGRIQVGEKGGIGWIEILQRNDSPLRHEQDVEWMRRLRMMERQQRLCLAQTFNGDRKTHVGKDPADHGSEKPKQFTHHELRNTDYVLRIP